MLTPYIRTHIPSGVKTICHFTGHQHWMFCDPASHGQRQLDKAMAETLAAWNRGLRSEWRYELMLVQPDIGLDTKSIET